jgi:hypothetical protein
MLPEKSREDIDFELVNLDEVKLGEGFSITVNIQASFYQCTAHHREQNWSPRLRVHVAGPYQQSVLFLGPPELLHIFFCLAASGVV